MGDLTIRNGNPLLNLDNKFNLGRCHLHRYNLGEIILPLLLPDFAWQAQCKRKEKFVPWVKPGMHIRIC